MFRQRRTSVQKTRRGSRDVLTTVIVLSVLSFAGHSFADNGDEDLLKQANKIFGPLPQAIVSEKNPITPEKVKLGKMLFYETRISVDGTVSCSRCHPIGLYTADGLRKSIGNNCKGNPRNAFVRRLIGIRQNHPVFRRRNFFQGRSIKGAGIKDILWLRPDGREMPDEEWNQEVEVLAEGGEERGRRPLVRALPRREIGDPDRDP